MVADKADRDPAGQPRRPGLASQGQPRHGEYRDRQRHAACHLLLPERKVADGDAGRIFQLAMHAVEQAPIAADGSFPLTLPRRVIGLDQVDTKMFAFGQIENLRDHAGLVGARRQRCLAHPPVAGPAGLADQDFLAGKGEGDPLADGADMLGRAFGADRKVLPVGQHMNRDEIDVLGDFAVAQPVFPDIGVGHRDFHAGLDRTNERAEVGRRSCRHAAAPRCPR